MVRRGGISPKPGNSISSEKGNPHPFKSEEESRK
jgi:hypothetical protein